MVLHIHSAREVRSRDAALRSQALAFASARSSRCPKAEVTTPPGERERERERERETLCVRVLFMCGREKGENEGGECARTNGAELVILDLM